ncbi:unnamed protein product [Ceutorhynchus assimilis]|uniref:Uncharacterized protein n=1 Tax=Ceutorhynchus assimilis TaxID=467358 RepID=A0A9N9MMG0_9CUCU|nr:unnamed protein product [Ceutorhynchus assimilis]
MLRNSLNDSDFLVALQIINQIFSFALPLCRFLQKSDTDLGEAIAMTENTISCLKVIRQDVTKQFETIFNKAQDIASSIDTNIQMKRVISRQKNRANPVIQNSETPVVDYFRIAIYIPFIDHFISQLEERFANHKQIFKGFMCLLTGEKSESDCNAYDELLDLYIPDVPKLGSFMNFSRKQLEQIPKEVLLACAPEEIALIWNKLPEHLKKDKDIIQYQYCTDHDETRGSEDVIDGPPPRKLFCCYCNIRDVQINAGEKESNDNFLNKF